MTPTPMPPVERIPSPKIGPEDAAIAQDGTVYTALRNDGLLLRIRPGAREMEQVADIGGRGLGCEVMADGRVLVCNADLGLQAVDPRTGKVEALLPQRFGQRFTLCNNASVARDGTIYFSESSTVYPLDRFRHDIVEDTRTGSLMRWKPGQAEPEVLLDNLGFANGVVLDAEETFVLVAETARCRIHRVWLDTGHAEIFAETPGYPDNMSLGSDGLFWVALPTEKNGMVTRLHFMPLFIRKMVAALPESLQPQIPRVCWVMAFDGGGRPVHFLAGDPDTYHYVTGVRERDGVVWLGSINEEALGRFELPKP